MFEPLPGQGSARGGVGAYIFHERELDEVFELLRGKDTDEILSDEDFYDCGEDIPSSDEEDSEEDSGYNYAFTDIRFRNIDEGWSPHHEETTRPTTTKTADSVQIPAGTASPYDYLKLLFTEQLLHDIVASTNEFAVLMMAECEIDNSVWKELDKAELLTFLGILFYMGSVKMLKFKHYWEENPLFECFVYRIMSKNRFLLIFRFLRFGHENLMSLIDHFNNTMPDLFTPGTNLTICDSLALNRDSVNILQLRAEIKLHALATRSGMAVQIQLYQRSDYRERIQTDELVKDLMSRYLDAGHHLYLDKFYNSVKLTEFFVKNNTDVTGRLRKRGKDNPSIISTSKLRKGECIYRFNSNGVCVCKWRKDSNILAVSTSHVSDLIQDASENGKMNAVPEMIRQYYKFTGSMKQDRLLKHYTCERQRMRWYKKVGLHIFQLMLMNAYLLYKMHKKPTKVDFYTFKEAIFTKLLPDFFH